MTAIDIRSRDRDVVVDVLRTLLPADARVWVFGSRARGTPRRASDLDLAIDAGRALSAAEMVALKDAFEESDLPYTVDVLDWRATSPGFRAIVGSQRRVLDFARAV